MILIEDFDRDKRRNSENETHIQERDYTFTYQMKVFLLILFQQESRISLNDEKRNKSEVMLKSGFEAVRHNSAISLRMVAFKAELIE